MLRSRDGGKQAAAARSTQTRTVRRWKCLVARDLRWMASGYDDPKLASLPLKETKEKFISAVLAAVFIYARARPSPSSSASRFSPPFVCFIGLVSCVLEHCDR